jgi:alpha-beta hydrolase superfamily lysophospholipase
MDNAPALGGDAARVALLAHSAGAHLALLALLHRAAAATGAPRAQRCEDGALCTADGRMPARAVLLAGAYNLERHWEYEERRGVHFLSTMERALGGWPAFAPRSPALVVAAAAARSSALAEHDVAGSKSAAQLPLPERSNKVESDIDPSAGHASSRKRRQPAAAAMDRKQARIGSNAASLAGDASRPRGECKDVARRNGSAAPLQPLTLGLPASAERFYATFPLHGDAVAERAGVSRSTVLPAPRVFDANAADAAERFAAQLGGAALARLPPVALLASAADTTVPWHESAEMAHALQNAGVRVRQLLYDGVKHADFAIDWLGPCGGSTRGASSTGEGGAILEACTGLGPAQRDTILLATGRVDI